MLPVLLSINIGLWVMFATSAYAQSKIGYNVSSIIHGVFAGAVVYQLTLVFNL